MPSASSAKLNGNRLLKRLPQAVAIRLRRRMQRVALDVSQVLYEAKGPIERAYFPIDCMLSAVAVMQDGSMIEVATVGKEGAVGLPPALESETSPNRVFAQVAGDAWCIGAHALRDESVREKALAKVLVLYQAVCMMEASQWVACNGLHSIQQRTCRRLLMTRDRLSSDELPMTHEFLSNMLGVRRAGVSEVLRSLQEKRLIRYSRGTIRVLDRAGLESKSCECYKYVTNEYKRLLG